MRVFTLSLRQWVDRPGTDRVRDTRSCTVILRPLVEAVCQVDPWADRVTDRGHTDLPGVVYVLFLFGPEQDPVPLPVPSLKNAIIEVFLLKEIIIAYFLLTLDKSG